MTISENWNKLCQILGEKYKKDVDLTHILYLIGIQEYGKGFQQFTKEEKMELIHLGACVMLSRKGFYKKMGVDERNFPLYERIAFMAQLSVIEETNLLKEAAIEYFKEIEIL